MYSFTLTFLTSQSLSEIWQGSKQTNKQRHLTIPKKLMHRIQLNFLKQNLILKKKV